jgi:hypothetical protein
MLKQKLIGSISASYTFLNLLGIDQNQISRGDVGVI